MSSSVNAHRSPAAFSKAGSSTVNALYSHKKKYAYLDHRLLVRIDVPACVLQSRLSWPSPWLRPGERSSTSGEAVGVLKYLATLGKPGLLPMKRRPC